MSASSGTIRRIAKELRDLQKKPIHEFCLTTVDGNVLEIHFTMVGPTDSPYEGGLYHGRVIIPSEYPFAPPDVMLLTPNGRFELNKRVCLSVSSYHPERWKPTWGIATVLHALRDFMTTPGTSGIGAINYPAEKRRELAQSSRTFACKECGAAVSEQWDTLLKDAPPATETEKGELPPPPSAEATPAATPAATAATAPAVDTPLALQPTSPAAVAGQQLEAPSPLALPPGSSMGREEERSSSAVATSAAATSVAEGDGPPMVAPAPAATPVLPLPTSGAPAPPTPVITAAAPALPPVNPPAAPQHLAPPPAASPRQRMLRLDRAEGEPLAVVVSIEAVDRAIAVAVAAIALVVVKKLIFDWPYLYTLAAFLREQADHVW